ncbi:MAG TPA: S53 family peptidase, partial [Verrucomicrobiae bacterium]|nr:S53 family peptidase [Verrucomicrobiae bacterium]
MKTTKNFLNFGLSALLALALPAAAAAQQMKTLSGHVPRVLSRFHLQPIADLPADTNLTIAISLPVQNEDVLDSLLSQIYNPASTNYHHYLKAGEFAVRFGPTAGDYQKVMDFAKANNLAIVLAYSNHMLLDVSGKASDIENAFHVKLRTYHHPFENRTFFAPDTDPTLDASVPIAHISGLDNFVIPRPLLKERPLNKIAPAAKSYLGSAPGGGYMGKDFRAAYAPGVTLDGSGQNIALFELDGYFTSDILAYETQAGLPNLTITNINVDGGVPNPTGVGDPEVSLDIEMDISMATNSSEIIVYEAPLGPSSSTLDLLNRIASDDLAKQISSSWVIRDDPAFDVYFKQMALQGQSFFQASGDEGAYYPGIFQYEDDTNVTLVGGTTLSTAGPQGAWSSETVWNWWIEFGAPGGTGGGTNLDGIPIPGWQQGVSMANNQGSTTLRNVPDVALTADNIFVIFENGQEGIFGGTSCAAPLWAAYTALVNEQAAAQNRPPVGFLNPAIYSIGLSSIYTNCFHDITTGNNTNSTVGNAYFAVPGYDLCTGWGTPNGSNLINALTASATVNPITHLSPPGPPYGSTLSALNGGNPNGKWELFALNDQEFNSGGISNGWILTLTT